MSAGTSRMKKEGPQGQTTIMWKGTSGFLITNGYYFPSVNGVFDILPFNILTATVLQVESLSIPKAEASTTFPKAPWPRVLPGKGRRYLISGTTLEFPVPRVEQSDWIIPCQSGYGAVIKTIRCQAVSPENL